MEKIKENDRMMIEQAVLDYVEAAYTVDPSRIKRSAHPELAKLGFIRKETGYRQRRMTFEELVEIVKTFNKDGHIPKDAPKNITIYEVLDQTASIKIEAWWGIDFIHLAKFNGKWLIINVLWQTHPQ